MLIYHNITHESFIIVTFSDYAEVRSYTMCLHPMYIIELYVKTICMYKYIN